MLLLGCDFTSSPTRRKPVLVALGHASNGRVTLTRLERHATLQNFEDFLCTTPAWTGAFDMPFGLPRELVVQLGWPTTWLDCMRHYLALERPAIRLQFKTFCDARPVGGKFAHRATDGPAGSSPSMKWVNPPVAYMLHAGMPLLLRAGAHLPGLHRGTQPARVALEAYPGLLLRELIGRRSYKADDRVRQTPERAAARTDAVAALCAGASRLGLRLALDRSQADALVNDASGDSLDAVACLVQAAWAQARHAAGDALYGLPPELDPLEGWIVSASPIIAPLWP